jgi:hypothetical protein
VFFCWDITITADTSEDDPFDDWLPLPKGIITEVTIKFPAGCHGMVKVRLFKESLQLIPLTEDEWVTGDDETVRTDTYCELLDKPFKLKIFACSPDTYYNHTITVRIAVQPEHAAGMSSLTRMFQSFLEKIGLTNEAEEEEESSE